MPGSLFQQRQVSRVEEVEAAVREDHPEPRRAPPRQALSQQAARHDLPRRVAADARTSSSGRTPAVPTLSTTTPAARLASRAASPAVRARAEGERRHGRDRIPGPGDVRDLSGHRGHHLGPVASHHDQAIGSAGHHEMVEREAVEEGAAQLGDPARLDGVRGRPSHPANSLRFGVSTVAPR